MKIKEAGSQLKIFQAEENFCLQFFVMLKRLELSFLQADFDSY